MLQVCFMLFMPDGYAQSHKFERLMHFGNPDQVSRVSCGDVYKNRTIVSDNDGYLYVTGNFKNNIDFDLSGGNTVLSSYTTGMGLDSQGRYIARYTPDGNLLWVRQFGNDLTSSSNIITAIDVDSMKNVYIVGHFAGSFNAKLVPGDSVVTSAASRDGMIMKVDSNGNHVWTRTIQNAYVHGITVNRQEGTIYATGAHTGTQDFDPGAGPADTAWLAAGGYLLKWDTDGRYIWAKSWPGATGYGIGYDPSGNVYVAGKFSGANRDFNPDPTGTQMLSSNGSSDIFVSSFDANGGFRWASGFGAAGQEESYSLETDAQGNSYFTGVFQDTVDFGGYEVRSGRNLTNPASRVMEVFIAKIDNAGVIQWASQLQGTGSNWGYALALGKGPAKGVFATGVIRGAVALNNPGSTTTITPAGTTEAFLVSLDENTGHFNWGGVLGAGSCGSLAMDPEGNLYAAGYLSNAYSRVDFDPGPDTFFSDRIGTSDGWITKLRYCHSSDTLRLTSCGSYVYDGNTTYSQSGVYVHINPKGCDTSSKLVLDLTIYHLDPRISVNGNILTATPGFDSYQWLRDDTLIQGATSSSYTVTKNGRYQVVVTSGSTCTDTSDSYRVNNIGIDRISELADQVSVYPNPASDHIYVNSPVPVHVQITTVDGRRLYGGIHRSGAVSLKDLASGIYLLHIRDLDHRLIRTEKLVRQ